MKNDEVSMFDGMQERFRDFCDACTEFVKAFTEKEAEAMEILADAIRQAADIVADLLPVIVDAVKEQANTKPPRDLVRSIGCRPKTKVSGKIEHRVQRR